MEIHKERQLKAKEDNRQWDLLPFGPLEEVVKVLEFGSVKHGAWSWRDRPTSYAERFGSVMRHLLKWWRGQDIDPQSGLPHLAHAACQLLFLIGYIQDGTIEDNRPFKKADAPEDILVVERHGLILGSIKP